VFGTKIILFLISILFFTTVFAQEDYSTYSKSELKDLARAAERINDSETAAIFYEAYLNQKPNDLKIVEQLADYYRKMGRYKAAENNYSTLVNERPKKYLLAEFYLAEMMKSQGKCKEAIPHYENFRRNYLGEKEDRKYRRLAKFNVEGCEQFITGKADLIIKEEVAVRSLDEINESHLEGGPIFLDPNILAFNSVRGNLKETYGVNEKMPKRDYYVAERKKGEWGNIKSWKMIPSLKEQQIANGAFNFDQSRFYFSACQTDFRGEINCDIYRMDKNGSNWSSPIRLGETVNTKDNETQVAVGLDENERETLYFVSDREGGKGGLDLWYSTYYVDKDKYRKPRNCGSRINSVGDEMTPFVSKESGKLFFSSDGHPGWGGLDVFESVGQRSRWEEPKNVNAKINTAADELYYVLNSTGVEGVFASNRGTKKGAKYCCDDFFEFKLLDSIRLVVNGEVSFNSSNKEDNFKNAKVKIYRKDKETDERYFQTMTIANDSGNFSIPLEPNQDYIVRVEKEGFLSEEQELSTDDQMNNKNYSLDYSLDEITEEPSKIENIQYEFGSTELSEDAKRYIDFSILKTLRENPDIIIEIGAHTDSKGTEGFNQNLSQKRAESVVKYLRSKGIAKERLQAKGYGETNPVAPNQNQDGSDNPEGRALNRRTEFKVIGKIEVKEDYDD
jgi:outer membrane protein OmpA-like peptidoglycan-associated protein/tetratricopeptide (TPR) repeat protein